MKKRTGLFYALAALLLSCGHHENNSISFKDKDSYYYMKASFNKNRTRAVEHYMNSKIGRKNNMSFLNVESNADFTLDDGTRFHLKKYPGFIEIELDKTANSSRSYYEVKEMCEGIKDVIMQ